VIARADSRGDDEIRGPYEGNVQDQRDADDCTNNGEDLSRATRRKGMSDRASYRVGELLADE
jgi:hypothetical protein